MCGHTMAIGTHEEHLVLPTVGAQQPAVTEDEYCPGHPNFYSRFFFPFFHRNELGLHSITIRNSRTLLRITVQVMYSEGFDKVNA